MEKRRQPEVIAGRITGAGAIAAGDGFTVNRTAAGTYVLTFAPGFRPVAFPSPVVEGSGTASFVARVDIGATVTVYLYGAGVLTDANFSFAAVGVQV